MGDFEEDYTEGVEKEGEIFLEGLNNNKRLSELEKEYSKKVKEIRRIYEKSIKKDLNRERKKEIEKINKKSKISRDGEVEAFKVKNLELEKNWKEKKEIEMASWGYRIKIKTINFIKKITPNFIIYLYFKVKRVLRDNYNEIANFLERIQEKVSDKILKILNYIKDKFIKLKNYSKEIIEKISEKLKRKKKDGKPQEDATKKPEKPQGE